METNVMFRLTVPLDPDAQCAASDWRRRVQDALPMGLALASAFIDSANLVVYVEAEADADVLIRLFADRLGLGPVSVCPVQPLSPSRDSETALTSSEATELCSLHRGALLRVGVTRDGRTLSLKVRHKPYEQIDRVDVKETDETVELTAWVGASVDDARRRYVTLEEAFSTTTILLDEPLGTRSIIEAS